jgi:KipI family sensor histidine kinase inhibitor
MNRLVQQEVLTQWITPTTLHCEFGELDSAVNKAQLIGRCRLYLYEHLALKLADVVPGFNELLVQFIPAEIDYFADLHNVQRLLKQCVLDSVATMPEPEHAAATLQNASAKTITRIPVDFTGDYDLIDVAQRLALSRTELIEQFCALEFSVILNGFMPGFIYLSGLPTHFQLPRLATPRLQVPTGAVAIADAYCGIYPQRSPGGWHILGVTDHVLFDIHRATPASFVTGDVIQFYSITPVAPDCTSSNTPVITSSKGSACD